MNTHWQEQYTKQLPRYYPTKEERILKAFPWVRKPYLPTEEQQVPKKRYRIKLHCEHDSFKFKAEYKPLISSTPPIVPILTAMARLKPEQFPYVNPREGAEIDLCEIILYLILRNDVPRLRALHQQVDPEDYLRLSSHFSRLLCTTLAPKQHNI